MINNYNIPGFLKNSAVFNKQYTEVFIVWTNQVNHWNCNVNPYNNIILAGFIKHIDFNDIEQQIKPFVSEKDYQKLLSIIFDQI